MLRFIIVRLTLIVITLLVVSMVIFGVTEALPGDAAQRVLGQYATEQSVMNLRKELGLDRSAPVRYLTWLVGWPMREGALFRTSDGGATWKRVNTNPILTSTSFVSPKLGWAISDELIYNTGDGGERWTRQLQSEHLLRDIEFVDDKHGWAVGARGTIYRTAEGGVPSEEKGQVVCEGSTLVSEKCEDGMLLTWDLVESGTTSDLTDIEVVDSSHLWVAGEKGLVLGSTDGGLSWETVYTGVEAKLLSVSFASAEEGVIVGESGTILVTADGGRTWRSSDSGTTLTLNAVDFVFDAMAEGFNRAAAVWAVGDGGTALYSRDIGVTWTSRTVGTLGKVALRAVSFDGANGVVVGTDGTVLTTSDGGTAWTRQEIFEDQQQTSTDQNPTARPLNDLAIHVSESGDVSAWAASHDTVWQSGVLGGDFGDSLVQRRPITDIIGHRLLPSIYLAVFAFLIAAPLAVLVGVWAGVHPNTIGDRTISAIGMVGISLPEFVTGLLLMIILSSKLGWLPTTSAIPRGESPLTKPEILVLPTLTLTGVVFGYIMRMTRANVIEVMESHYVRTAILKGLPMRRVIFRHVVPNAMLPTISIVAAMTGWLLAGLIIVENVFAYPGLGQLVLNSIQTRDAPLLQACALIIAVTYTVSTLLADLSYAVLDPRIRYT